MTLEITLTVEYSTGAASDIKLVRAAQRTINHIFMEDLLTRGTDAEVHSWSQKIRRVNKRLPTKAPF